MIKFIKSLFKNEDLKENVNDKTFSYDQVYNTPLTYTPPQEYLYNVDVNGNLNTVQVNTSSALLVEGIEEWILQLVAMDSDSLACTHAPDVYLRVKDAKTGAIFLLRRES